jgi:hypothetical protein
MYFYFGVLMYFRSGVDRTIIDGSSWKWRIRYKKFRGRGLGAFEKESGADGIVQIEVRQGQERGQEKVQFKGLLFQAKKPGRRNRQLSDQVERMEKIAPGGSAVFEYGPKSYRAIPGDHYIAFGRRNRKASTGQPIGRFLAQDFLPCAHGKKGMHYDANRLLLILPDGSAYKISLTHRLLIEAFSSI